jgi:hypothetical protein
MYTLQPAVPTTPLPWHSSTPSAQLPDEFARVRDARRRILTARTGAVRLSSSLIKIQRRNTRFRVSLVGVEITFSWNLINPHQKSKLTSCASRRAHPGSTAAIAMHSIVSMLLTIFELDRPRTSMFDFPSVGSLFCRSNFAFRFFEVHWQPKTGARSASATLTGRGQV